MSLIQYKYRTRRLADSSLVAVSETGDLCYLADAELDLLRTDPQVLSIDRQSELLSKFFLRRTQSPGMALLYRSRVAERHRTIRGCPRLHIIVPTLWCEHSCKYCQVSRSTGSGGFSMSEDQIDQASDCILAASGTELTVEYQGGDPLLRFDLVERSMARIRSGALSAGKTVHFVIASTLHQLTPQMCDVLKEYGTILSTSIDGPPELHNKNRPVRGRDAYEKTAAGIELARKYLGQDSVAALMTTTRESLQCPERIVDEYVSLEMAEICLRPLSPFGFATKKRMSPGIPQHEFKLFYEKAFDRILYWNRNGVSLREGQAAVALNKLLHPIDAGYVDLQAVNGGNGAVLVYNYDGYIYPSDEARMLAEMGDTSLRIGKIGDSIINVLSSAPMLMLRKHGSSESNSSCQECAYGVFCGPDPVMAKAQLGKFDVAVEETEHCKRSMWLFDFLLLKMKEADEQTRALFYSWAGPAA